LLFKLPYLERISHYMEKELYEYTKTNKPDSKLRSIMQTNLRTTLVPKTPASPNLKQRGLQTQNPHADLFASAKTEEIS